MDDRSLHLYLSRILSGYFIFVYGKQRWTLRYPNTSIKYEAEILSEIEYEDNKYSEWPTLESVVELMVSQGMWDYSGDDRLEKLNKTIENLKVDLFKNFLIPTTAQKIRKDIKKTENSYYRLYQARHAFDYVTLESHCNEVKNNFLLRRSLYDADNKLYFLENDDSVLLQELSRYLSQHSIEIRTYREIARSNQWHQYWNGDKSRLFDKPVVEWTDEQRTLVSLTRMYDSAREHPDCPGEEVMNDDDAFDGWAITERRKTEKEKSKKRAEKMLPGKLKNANEIYVVANSKQEAQDIYNLNDYGGQAIIKERENMIKRTQGSAVKEQNLPDVQRDLIIESNQKRTLMMRKK
jgi:hypothetical protein